MDRFTPLRLVLLAALACDGPSPAPSSSTPEPGREVPAEEGMNRDATAIASDAVAPAVARSCEDPVTLVDGRGAATGYVRCADGSVNRHAEPKRDLSAFVDTCQGDEVEPYCATAADCAPRKTSHATCTHRMTTPPLRSTRKPVSTCVCTYACVDDAECRDASAEPRPGSTGGLVGICDAGLGMPDQSEAVTLLPSCSRANCAGGDECASGECGLVTWQNAHCRVQHRLFCRTAEDTCRTAADCTTEGDECRPNPEGVWGCAPPVECRPPVPGRPLTVNGQARVAACDDRGDWLAAATPRLPHAALRKVLAARWERLAAAEHASVASFARVTLQLMALGAPPELLAQTQRAAADEVEHARLAYGLASAYAGRPLGPDTLPIHDLVLGADPREVMTGLIEEACVNETLGVAEAQHAASTATDPEVRRVLVRIAEDEQRHAALAWRTLQWMFTAFPALREHGRDTLHAALARVADRAASEEIDLPEHGLLGARSLRSLNDAATRDVLRPLAQTLLSQVDGDAPEPSRPIPASTP